MGIAIFIISAMVYFFIGGLAQSKISAIAETKCGRSYHDLDHCGHIVAANASVVLWPFIVPTFLGMNAGVLRQTRTERRHEREIAEAKHKAELAKLKRIENEELDKQLGSGV